MTSGKGSSVTNGRKYHVYWLVSVLTFTNTVWAGLVVVSHEEAIKGGERHGRTWLGIGPTEHIYP
jgi:hypothetical protein